MAISSICLRSSVFSNSAAAAALAASASADASSSAGSWIQFDCDCAPKTLGADSSSSCWSPDAVTVYPSDDAAALGSRLPTFPAAAARAGLIQVINTGRSGKP